MQQQMVAEIIDVIKARVPTAENVVLEQVDINEGTVCVKVSIAHEGGAEAIEATLVVPMQSH